MATVNYDDERFQQVTREQDTAIQNLTNTYNNMINQSQQFYDAQARAAEDYGRQQQELQQANTDFTIQQIEQQKERAEQDYTKEQKGAYVDWQKASNQYGVNAEQMASRGLRNGGYSESSQVSMYNQYQNRVGQARESYNRAVQDYDASITEARLTNNAKLAEIAYKTLQTKLESNLNGFQYKNQLMLQQINALNAERDRGYNKWQDVLKQINYENEQAENQRRYEEQMAAQRAAQQATSRSYSTSSSSKSSKSNNNSYSIKSGNNLATIGQEAGKASTNIPTSVNGKKLTETNDYIQGANGEYLQLSKTPDGTTYYYNGSKWVKWADAPKKTETKKTSTTSKKENNNFLSTLWRNIGITTGLWK